jgi:hypothetical protein
MLLSLVVLSLAACGPQTSMDPDAIPDGSPNDDAQLGIGMDDKGDGTTLGYRSVMQLAHDAGVPCNSRVVIATAIARAESSFRVTVSHSNPNGSTDYGLWQINSVHDYTPAYLENAENNAAAMDEISDGGKTYHPWATYNSGAYKRYLSAAWTAQANYACE